MQSLWAPAIRSVSKGHHSICRSIPINDLHHFPCVQILLFQEFPAGRNSCTCVIPRLWAQSCGAIDFGAWLLVSALKALRIGLPWPTGVIATVWIALLQSLYLKLQLCIDQILIRLLYFLLAFLSYILEVGSRIFPHNRECAGPDVKMACWSWFD